METAKSHPVVADMSKQREAAANAPYTFEHALKDAEWLRSTPDGLLTPEKHKQLAVTLLAAIERSTCFKNATIRGQEVFVLVQQDRAAPSAIVAWAGEADEHGCDPAKTTEAYRTAARWRNQPLENTKWPT